VSFCDPPGHPEGCLFPLPAPVGYAPGYAPYIYIYIYIYIEFYELILNLCAGLCAVYIYIYIYIYIYMANRHRPMQECLFQEENVSGIVHIYIYIYILSDIYDLRGELNKDTMTLSYNGVCIRL